LRQVEIIAEKSESLPALSWAGYLKAGRGALYVILGSPKASENIPVITKYFAEATFKKEGTPAEMAQSILPLIERYDPPTEFVLLAFARDDESAARLVKIVSPSTPPPEAHRRALIQGVDFDKVQFEWPSEIDVKEMEGK
jgi:hypothetical protein